MLNLFKKKVSVSVECGLCGFYGETVMYALLFCKNAQEVWELTLFLEVIQYRSCIIIVYTSLMYSSASSVLTHAQGVLDSFASVPMPSNLGLLGEDSVDLMCSTSDEGSSVRLYVLWERPSEGWCELNTDAAVDRHKGLVCFGALIRNRERLVMVVGVDHFFF